MELIVNSHSYVVSVRVIGHKAFDTSFLHMNLSLTQHLLVARESWM